MLEVVSEKEIKTVRTIDMSKISTDRAFRDNGKVVIDIRDLPNGTYYLRVKNQRLEKAKQVDTIRFLVKK